MNPPTPGIARFQPGSKPNSTKAHTPGNATLQRGPKASPLTEHSLPTGQAGAWRSQDPSTTQRQPWERHAPAWPVGSPKSAPSKTEGLHSTRQEPGAPWDDDSPTIPPPTEGKWRSRGYIPHFDSETVIQHVNFHLADSLPANVLERIEQQLGHLPATQQNIERRKQAEAWIDAGHGNCMLAQPEAATLVQNALLHFDADRYRLFAWVIMPNHVHALFQPIHSWSLSKIVTTWKSFTGRRLMPLLHQSTGSVSHERVWHREYWDRFIRDQKHFHAVVEYIHNNPVKAHLTDQPQHWPWSSASPGIATLQRGPKASPLTEHSLPTGQAGAWRSQDPSTTQRQPWERHAPAWPVGSPLTEHNPPRARLEPGVPRRGGAQERES